MTPTGYCKLKTLLECTPTEFGLALLVMAFALGFALLFIGLFINAVFKS